jgi:Rod binding domain-containing protein
MPDTLSLAAQDLGLGDDLLKQMQEQDKARREKAAQDKAAGLGPATAMLFAGTGGV